MDILQYRLDKKGALVKAELIFYVLTHRDRDIHDNKHKGTHYYHGNKIKRPRMLI